MRREVTQRELRNTSGQTMRALDEGEEFVVTRNGTPVGELTPLRRQPLRGRGGGRRHGPGRPSVDDRRFRALEGLVDVVVV